MSQHCRFSSEPSNKKKFLVLRQEERGAGSLFDNQLSMNLSTSNRRAEVEDVHDGRVGDGLVCFCSGFDAPPISKSQQHLAAQSSKVVFITDGHRDLSKNPASVKLDRSLWATCQLFCLSSYFMRESCPSTENHVARNFRHPPDLGRPLRLHLDHALRRRPRHLPRARFASDIQRRFQV